LGIIPHFRDQGDRLLRRFQFKEDVRVIDILGDIEETVDAVASCEAIVSSSLHGLIMAHAYGVPAAWIQLGDRVKGDGFKFRDYLRSIGRNDTKPSRLSATTQTTELVESMSQQPVDIDLERLWNACPFRNI
jgi:pyruvyltransferase